MTIIEAMAIVNDTKAAYEALRAENDICGYETVSFEEWIGARDLKAEKQELYFQRERDDTLDLY